MRTLLLMRHAKSSWGDGSLSDDERPLNKRGLRDAPRMAAKLHTRGIIPDILLSSTAERAYQTACFVAQEYEFPIDSIVALHELYLAEERTWYDIFVELPETRPTAMLFGHNPGITEVANSLCNVEIENVPTAGIVTIELDVPTWSDVTPGSGKLLDFDYPKR
ncbi:MAG: histidine phosphatase family protein [Bdellovibrionales bacterium]|nr:histidine phosphatase family protein [Bdellovibrionales bacterium]